MVANVFFTGYSMNRHLRLCAALLLAIPAALHAQTALKLDQLLEIEAVSYEQAAWFVLEAADVVEPVAAPEHSQAFGFALERKWLPKNAAPNDRASLEGVALLIMRSFDMRGGLLYSVFKNSHYAYRELVYRDIIQGRVDPNMIVPGDMLIFLVNRVFMGDDDVAAEERKIRRLEEDRALLREINTRIEAGKLRDVSVRLTDEGVTISISNIQFLADSTELPETEKEKIRQIAWILEGIPMRNILVGGHTALAGTEESRQEVSLGRAQSVSDYLISLGVRKKSEVTIRGYGSDRPIADNDTPEGMALNRRVEITILRGQR